MNTEETKRDEIKDEIKEENIEDRLSPDKSDGLFDEGLLDEEDFDTETYVKRREEEEKAKEGKKRPLLRILFLALGLLAVIYLGVSIFLMGRFPFNTTLNGEDVSLKKPAEVEEEMNSRIAAYTLSITGRNGAADTITASEISLVPEYSGEIKALAEDLSPFAWPARLFKTTELTCDIPLTCDETALEEKVNTLTCFDEERIVLPTDACVVWDGNTFSISPEEQGSYPEKEKVLEAVKNAVLTLTPTLDLDETGCYRAQALTADDSSLLDEESKLNALISSSLTIDVGAGDTVSVNGSTLKDWLLIAEDGSVSFDSDKILTYVRGLGREYNTIYTNRGFTTHDGDSITTVGGSYGWWMDESSTATALAAALLDGSFEASAVWFEEARARGDNETCGKGSFGGDIGSTYVEVDLDSQKVYMWQDGSCVLETDCVSGKASAGNGTPVGVYPINYKERDATLVGENYSSAVSYWMPFNGNVGLHDASWRSSFGGDIYVSGGSHGCVNLPESAAKELYDYVEKGVPVVVYGGMTQTEANAYLSEKKKAANAAKITTANRIAEAYGIDTTGAKVNSDGSVTYAIGATVFPDGHITGADGTTIVAAGQ